MCNPNSAFGILTAVSFEDHFAAEVASHRYGMVLVQTRSGKTNLLQYNPVSCVVQRTAQSLLLAAFEGLRP